MVLPDPLLLSSFMSVHWDMESWKEDRGIRSFEAWTIGSYLDKEISRNDCIWDFPGGAVVKNPPADTGDMGSSPGLGRSHVP